MPTSADTTVFITGANRGLGLEFVRQYKAKGCTVIGACRDPEGRDARKLHDLADRVVQCDKASGKSVKAMAKAVKGVPIDILINNGALNPDPGDLADLDMDRVEEVVVVNSVGQVRVMQALLPNLRKGSRKIIASVSSDLGSISGVTDDSIGYYAYRAGKAALNMFKACIGRELKREGFTCLSMHPGWVQTRMGGDRAPLDARTSVEGMIGVIDRSMPEHSGGYVDFTGRTLPW